MFLSLSALALAVGDGAGSCCASCSLISPCDSGLRGLRIADDDADDVPGVGVDAASSYPKFSNHFPSCAVVAR